MTRSKIRTAPKTMTPPAQLSVVEEKPNDLEVIEEAQPTSQLSGVFAEEAQKLGVEMDLDSNTVSFKLSGHYFVIREPNAMDMATVRDWIATLYERTGELPGQTRAMLKMVQLCVIRYDQLVSDDPSIPAIKFKDLYKLAAKPSDTEALAAAIGLFPALFELLDRAEEGESANQLPEE